MTTATEIHNLRWLLDSLAVEAPGVRSVVVVSSDGLPLLSTDPAADANTELATVVSGLASLTLGAAELMDGGAVRQTMVAMDQGCLLVMTIGDGALLGVLTAPEADMSVVCYHMALFVGRVGHVLTPQLRGQLRASLSAGV
ncbi:Serine protease inhibitor [Streptomyces sp. RB5]|uniref:Serine protease inhibitor n=1 Tax=Streptomyces smaragdinus TaxID=2585196 RepID=A0A7K0CKB9_9ACTN|nr:roadblock/LC7 domain-containing protein [Streptomyces smaragdinus]MQY13683.1 Serine protease inhibitor [Streptomyces smaragdinus]